jgi:hypothetical protein
MNLILGHLPAWLFLGTRGHSEAGDSPDHTPPATMVASRQRHSHRIRRASGLTRPVLGPLAEFWSSFQPDDLEPRQIQLRFRSAPWDDIISDEEPWVVQSSDEETTPEDDASTTTQPDGSSWQNLLPTRQPPVFYKPIAVPSLLPQSAKAQQSPFLRELLQEGCFNFYVTNFYTQKCDKDGAHG